MVLELGRIRLARHVARRGGEKFIHNISLKAEGNRPLEDVGGCEFYSFV